MVVKQMWKRALLLLIVISMLMVPYMNLLAAPVSGLTIHFKKPESWSKVQMFYYGVEPGTVPGADWNNAPEMTAEGDGWFVYTIANATSARVMFHNGQGLQIPNGEGYLRTAEGWFDGINWFNSNPDTLAPDTEAPSVPSDLVVSSVKAKSAMLNWTASTDSVGVSGYEIWANGSKLTESSTNSFFAINLTPETEYSFSVKAKDAAGNISAASAEQKVTTTAFTQPEGLTIHFKKPAAWAKAQLYYYGQEPANVPGVQWGTAPEMTAESNGWFVYTIEYASKATILFHDGAGNQLPASVGFTRTAEGWFDGTKWSDTNPDTPPADTEGPTVPTGLASSDVTANSVKLIWTASTDNVAVTGYEVWQNDAKLADTADTNYTVSGLSAETTYKFKVRAKDAANNYSAATEDIDVTTLAAPPADTEIPTVPTGLASSDVTASGVKLTWTASTDNVGVTGYEVWQNDAKVADTADTNYTVSGLTAETTYKFKVRAKDAANNFSAATDNIDVTTLAAPPADTEAPTAPTGLASSEISATSFILSWTASTDNVGVVGYEVLQGEKKLAESSSETVQLNGLTPETKYTVTVRSKDAAGNVSALSNPLDVTTIAIPKNEATIYYKRGAFETAYAHYGIGGQWTQAPGVAMKLSEYVGYSKIVIDLGQSSSVQVAFNNGSGTWDNNNTKNYSFTKGVWTAEAAPGGGLVAEGEPKSGKDTEAPTVPVDLKVSGITTTGLTLTWSNSSDNIAVAKYEVWQDDKKVADSETNSYTFSGLETGKTYSFKVRTIDIAGNASEASASVEGTTSTVVDNEVPTAPTGLASSAVTHKALTLTWTAATDNTEVTGYEIWQDGVQIGTSKTTTFNVTGLSAETTFKFKVLAYDASGNKSPATDEISATTLKAPNNQITIYYKKGFATPYIHYSAGGGAWTAVPGKALVASEYFGYSKITIGIGEATSITAAFNNGGSSWDSDNMKNYTFGIGTWTFTPSTTGGAGKIVSGIPTDLIVAPGVPTGVVFSNTGGSAKVTWKSVAKAIGYKIYVDGKLTATLLDVNSYTFNTSKWTKGKTYNLQISAYNEAGDGLKTNNVKGSAPNDVILVVGKKVFINGKQLPASVQPQSIQGRMYLPFKSIFEPFGVKATWTSRTKTIAASKPGFALTLVINSKTAKLNGKNVALDAAPTVIKGSTFVPLRFVGESLGVTVQYRAK